MKDLFEKLDDLGCSSSDFWYGDGSDKLLIQVLDLVDEELWRLSRELPRSCRPAFERRFQTIQRERRRLLAKEEVEWFRGRDFGWMLERIDQVPMYSERSYHRAKRLGERLEVMYRQDLVPLVEKVRACLEKGGDELDVLEDVRHIRALYELICRSLPQWLRPLCEDFE